MSYLVLARKWRPQSFHDLVGQDHVRRTLENAIAQGRVAHAFLFTGVRGVGKTTSARILAKALNCEKGPTAEPCLKCAPCLDITAGSDLDVQEIDGASYNGVNEVRALQEQLPYRPTRDRFKIYIVDEVHMLSQAAWNAFLKTLEEPPPHVKFIFATTEVHKVPITILSRCQRYDFKMLSAQTIAGRLRYVLEQEKIAADDNAVHLLAREAAGSMRDAMSLLDQAIAWAGDRLVGDEVARVLGVASRAVLDRLAAALVGGQPDVALRIVAQLVDNGYDLAQVARDLLAVLRDLVVARVCTEPGMLLDLSEDERRATAELAGRASVDDLVRLHQGFSRSFDDIVRSPAPRAGLEMALVRLARRPPLMPLDALLERLADLERRLGGGDPGGGGPEPGRPGGGGGSKGSSKHSAPASASSASPSSTSGPSATVTPLPQAHAALRIEAPQSRAVLGATALAARFDPVPDGAPLPEPAPSSKVIALAPTPRPAPPADPSPTPRSNVAPAARPAPPASAPAPAPAPAVASAPAAPARRPRPWLPALHDDLPPAPAASAAATAQTGSAPTANAPASTATRPAPATNVPAISSAPAPGANAPATTTANAPAANAPAANAPAANAPAANAPTAPAGTAPTAPAANSAGNALGTPTATRSTFSRGPASAPPGSGAPASAAPGSGLAGLGPASSGPAGSGAAGSGAAGSGASGAGAAGWGATSTRPTFTQQGPQQGTPRPTFTPRPNPTMPPASPRPGPAAPPASAPPASARPGPAAQQPPARPDGAAPVSRPPASAPAASPAPAWRTASPTPRPTFAPRPAAPPSPPAGAPQPPDPNPAPGVMGRPAGRSVRVQPGALSHDPTKPMPEPLPGVDFAVWRRIVDHVRDGLPALASVLERASPMKLSAEGVVLGFSPHSFEATRIEEPKYNEPLARALRAELGADVKVTIERTDAASEALTLWRIKAAELWERREAMRKRVLAHPAVVAAIEELGAELRDVRVDSDEKR